MKYWLCSFCLYVGALFLHIYTSEHFSNGWFKIRMSYSLLMSSFPSIILTTRIKTITPDWCDLWALHLEHEPFENETFSLWCVVSVFCIFAPTTSAYILQWLRIMLYVRSQKTKLLVIEFFYWVCSRSHIFIYLMFKNMQSIWTKTRRKKLSTLCWRNELSLFFCSTTCKVLSLEKCN